MESAQAAFTADWISTPHLRPDFRGPINRAFTPLPDPAAAPSILDTLRNRVNAHPAAISVETDREATSYVRLWRAATHLAGEIHRVGAGAGVVGVLLPGDASYVAAVFACLMAGSTCVLLEESYPAERNRRLAEQTGLTALICSDMFAGEGNWPRLRLIQVRPGQLLESHDVLPAGQRIGMDAPAFVLCTSGSTGEPKAIAHSQRTMLHWARTTHEALHVRVDDRVLSLSSLSTLGGLTGMLNFLLAGVCVQMCDLKREGMPGLLDTLNDGKVTILRAAPSLLKTLARVPECERAMRGLRVVQTYGEALLKADLQAWRPLLPARCHVRTTFGSTEASGLSWFAGPGDDYDPIRVAAGVLMPDTVAAIVDDDGASCPAGEAGELHIRSRYNSLGAWVDGGVDTSMFVPHEGGDSTRIFATGDLARCHPDGVFVVLGRRDRMAKINGQRLDPSEIEWVLRSRPEVEEAEVIVDGRGGRVLAFVSLANDAPADTTRLLRDALRVALPAFMVPSRIVQVGTMPRLPGGKVDAVALQRLCDASGSAEPTSRTTSERA